MLKKFSNLGKDALIYGLGSMVSQFLGLILLPIYTRFFSPADYGVLDTTNTIILFTAVLLVSSVVGTSLSYFFYKAEDITDKKSSVTTVLLYILAANSLIALVVWRFSSQISFFIFQERGYDIYIRLLMISLPFRSLTGFNSNLFRLRFMPWRYFAITLTDLLLSMGLNIWLIAFVQTGLIGVFYTEIFTQALVSLTGLWLNRDLLDIGSISRARLREILAYGLPLIPGGMAMWVINYVDRMFLIHYHGLAEVGLYAIGNKVGAAVAMITAAFRLAYAPHAFSISREENAAQFYAVVVKYYMLGLFIIATGISIAGREIIEVFTAEEYLSAYPAVPFYAFSSIMYGLYPMVGIGLYLTKKTKITGTTILVAGFVHAALLWVFVPAWGFIGAGFATLITHAGVVLFFYFVSRRYYPIPYETSWMAMLSLMTTLFVIAGILLNVDGFWLRVLLKSGLILLYLTALFAFNIFKREDVRAGVQLVAAMLPAKLGARLCVNKAE